MCPNSTLASNYLVKPKFELDDNCRICLTLSILGKRLLTKLVEKKGKYDVMAEIAVLEIFFFF